MRYLWAVLMGALVSLPAHALKVTNLDEVPHTIAFEHAGNVETRELQPDETTQFFGYHEGQLSLVTMPEKETPKRDAVVHSDGVLEGILGAARTQDIPTRN